MKPTSEQTRKGVLSAVPCPPEDLLNMKSSFRYTMKLSDAAGTPHPAVVDPSTAYGCVDWFIYPDSKAVHA
jgi:hypothetical protein